MGLKECTHAAFSVLHALQTDLSPGTSQSRHLHFKRFFQIYKCLLHLGYLHLQAFAFISRSKNILSGYKVFSSDSSVTKPWLLYSWSRHLCVNGKKNPIPNFRDSSPIWKNLLQWMKLWETLMWNSQFAIRGLLFSLGALLLNWKEMKRLNKMGGRWGL